MNVLMKITGIYLPVNGTIMPGNFFLLPLYFGELKDGFSLPVPPGNPHFGCPIAGIIRSPSPLKSLVSRIVFSWLVCAALKLGQVVVWYVCMTKIMHK
jgi:hypothetical protein